MASNVLPSGHQGEGEDVSLDPLSLQNIPQPVLDAQYAVRGELVQRAQAISAEIKKGKKYPFPEVVLCNVGNPQSVGNPSISFIRQVCSCVEFPPVMESLAADGQPLFPSDVVKRAQKYLASTSGKSVGQYTESSGLLAVREEVAHFIEQRDGNGPVDPERIFLSDGASSSIKVLLQLLVRDQRDGIMTPIPQYPLYSASITLLNGTLVPYKLRTDDKWSLNAPELRSIFDEQIRNGVLPRAIVVINPGNPTGMCLSVENMREIVDFCGERNLVLLADEVYQENIYIDRPFVSFRKIVMESKYRDTLQIASFHSCSKGFYGECGKRGGYMELLNFADDALTQITKLVSVSLCSNVIGQIAMGCVVNPPRPGEPSYDLFAKQKDEMLRSLKARAELLVGGLNELPGFHCYIPEGAMYAFPEFRLPPRAVKEATAKGKKPDVFYCLELLEATGICVVPGSGFGMIPEAGSDKYYFRTTFLPSEEALAESIQRMRSFHEAFLKKHDGASSSL